MADWQRLAVVLLEALGDHVAESGHPAWVYVAPEPGSQDEETFVLGLSEDPAALLGRTAPPEWQAVGVVATGRIRTLVDGPARTCAPRRTGATLRMSCLVTRQDGVYCKAVTSNGRTIEQPPESGAMLDALKHCLGLPAKGSPMTPATHSGLGAPGKGCH